MLMVVFFSLLWIFFVILIHTVHPPALYINKHVCSVRSTCWDSAPAVQCTCRLYLCVRCYGMQFTHKASQRFVLFPGGALHMYKALRLFNLHLWWALLQLTLTSIFTCALKNHILANKGLQKCETISHLLVEAYFICLLVGFTNNSGESVPLSIFRPQ